MAEEEFLSRYRARRVDHNLFASRLGRLDKGWHILKERRLEDTSVISVPPQMALERLQVRCLDITLNQISDMGFEGRSIVAILLWESLPIRYKGMTIPLFV